MASNLDIGASQTGGLDIGAEQSAAPSIDSWQAKTEEPTRQQPSVAYLTAGATVPVTPPSTPVTLDQWEQPTERPPTRLKRIYPTSGSVFPVLSPLPPSGGGTGCLDIGAIQSSSIGLDIGAVQTCGGSRNISWNTVITSELLWGDVTQGIAAHATITSELLWDYLRWVIISTLSATWTLESTSNVVHWDAGITSQLIWAIPAGTPPECIGGDGSPSGGSVITTGGNGNYCF